jgi:diguanylate cyclase (GGDEF)-like protein/PAS domain S-box-containing protein
VESALLSPAAGTGADPLEQLTALEHRVNRILVEADDASAALSAALCEICGSQGWAAARYWRFDETRDVMRLELTTALDGSTALESTTRPKDPVFAPAAGPIDVAAETTRPVWTADVAEHGHSALQAISELGVNRSALYFPVRSHEQVLGVLEFRAPHIPEPDEVLLRGLHTLCMRAATMHRKLVEWETLRENDECVHSTFELAAIGIAHVDGDGRMIHVNRQLCKMLGYSKDELVGRTVKEISHPDDANATDSEACRLHAGEIKSFTAEKRYLHKDGKPIWVRITAAVRRDSDGAPMYDVSVVEDISTRKAAEERLRASEEFYHSTFELAAIGISHVGPKGELLHVNRRFCHMLGYTAKELVGRTVKEISHPDDTVATDADRVKLRAGEIDSFNVEKRYLRKDGMPIWVRITVAMKRDADGEPLYDVSIIEDISQRKAAETRIEYLATHDELTRLPNRSMFGQALVNAIESARRYGRRFAVLFIDLDRFKVINDSLGHEAGDALLKEISSRFRTCVRASDIVARLGGDEFVVLVQEVQDSSEIAIVARNLLSAAIKPVDLGGQECRVTASIGVCRYPDDGQDVQSLLKNADMAMYLAKEEGKNNFQFFSNAINSQMVERLELENALRRAVERDEFHVHYQPKLDVATNEITGVEALLRWDSPALGSVPPARFIPVAEEMGLIIPLGRWVLKAACAQNVAWQAQGLPAMTMAVNLSPRQFRDPDLLHNVAAALEETGMAPALLDLEITEGMLMHNLDQAITKLNALKEMEVRLSIDDFGTGYSSLAQLKRLPIDTLKVDRSFIRDLPSDREDQAITQAIIAMGRTLGVTVIAEGVETAEQQSFLQSHHCDQIQGFYFSRPCDPMEFAERVREHLQRPR